MIAGIRLRTHFSLVHAQMAAFHARAAASVHLDGTEDAAIEMSAHVSAAVMCSSAFVEATANELIEHDGRESALIRLNNLLLDSNSQSFKQTEATFLAAQTLFDLRNRLAHYKHDWLDWGTEDLVGPNTVYASTLYEALSNSFEFLPEPAGYTPRFLSPGCAAWAVTSAISFLDDFYARRGLCPNHDHLRHRIEVVWNSDP